MRAIVLLLLIANVALLGWGLTREAPAPERAIAPPVLPIGVEALQLLSEVSPLAARPASAADAGAICMRVGPLADSAAADDVVERAVSLGFAAYAEPVEIPGGPPDLQVHLPPLPSAEQASRAVRELDALGMEAYVVPRGQLAGAVSVGMFTALERAEVRRAEVAALGYPVRIAEIPRMRQVFDVRLRGRARESVDRFLLSLREDWPELSGDRAPCEDGEST